jgi:hypothetical protein
MSQVEVTMSSSNGMRVARDAGLALGMGLLWGSLVLDLIGFIARSSGGSPLAEMSALAAGDRLGFVLIALAKDALIFVGPSLLIGYLIVRVFLARPMFYAVLAGIPMFLIGVFSLAVSLVSGDTAGARGIQGVYMALNAVLVLVAIPASVALIQRSTRFFPGASAPAG